MKRVKIRNILTAGAMLLTAASLITGCTGTQTPGGKSGLPTGGQVTPAGDNTDAEEDPALNVFPEGANIEIGIFWQPPREYTTPEQYDWIRDANITFIEMTNRDGATDSEEAAKEVSLARERGIRVAYAPGADGKNVLSMSAGQLEKYFSELAQDPAIYGIHIADEPAQPWTYAKVIAAAAKAGLAARLNQLPYFATWVFDNYRCFIEDSIIAAGKENYNVLSYDQYPFPYYGGDPDMFYNLDLFRQIGLKYDVPTSFYVQSIGEGGNFRRTNGGEIRYHTSAGLAYGLKSMSYFTWWTTGFCDPKDYAIISPYGEKTDIYDDVARVNADILTAGPLLVRLDALKVYHTGGSEQAIEICGKDDVPLYAAPQGSYGLIISLMEDRETGRDYVMLVNKNYKDPVTYEFSVSSAVTHLYDCTRGSYEPLDISGGSVTLEFLPGGFSLLALGQKDNAVSRVMDISADLAEGKPVSASHVEPGGGYYASCITDGLKDSTDPANIGYRSSRKTGWLEVDLGRVTAVNRIDLYPTGSNFTRGNTFPQGFTLELSADRENWVRVASETGYTEALHAIPSFRFAETQARYVRFNVTEASPEGGYELGEIEIYNDDGSIPEPQNDRFYADATDVVKGQNLAKGKSVKALSNLGGDWDKSHVTDGDLGTNYSSALNRHATADGVEWVRIDLGAALEFNEVRVYPRGDGQHFPYRFRVEISDDGKEFTSVYDCHIPEIPSDGEPSVCLLDNTYTARYVRIYAYELRDQAGFNDGHLLQLREVEIYNN